MNEFSPNALHTTKKPTNYSNRNSKAKSCICNRQMFYLSHNIFINNTNYSYDVNIFYIEIHHVHAIQCLSCQNTPDIITNIHKLIFITLSLEIIIISTQVFFLLFFIHFLTVMISLQQNLSPSCKINSNK